MFTQHVGAADDLPATEGRGSHESVPSRFSPRFGSSRSLRYKFSSEAGNLPELKNRLSLWRLHHAPEFLSHWEAVDQNPPTHLISRAKNMILQKFCSRRDCLALVMNFQSTAHSSRAAFQGSGASAEINQYDNGSSLSSDRL